MRKILTLILTVLLAFTLVGCDTEDEAAEKDYVRPEQWQTAGSLLKKYESEGKDLPIVKMTYVFTDGNGKDFTAYMEFTLFPDLAPVTVKNFLDLTSSGFYDGLPIHRIIEGTAIQGGDPSKANVQRDQALTIKGEFENNEFFNNLMHTKGVISMAKVPKQNDSASSQFFIVYNDFSVCDGDYAAFGVLNTYNKTYTERKVDRRNGILYDYDALAVLANMEVNDETPVAEIIVTKIEVVA